MREVVDIRAVKVSITVVVQRNTDYRNDTFLYQSTARHCEAEARTQPCLTPEDVVKLEDRCP